MCSVVAIERGESRQAADLLAGQNRVLEMIASSAPLADILTRLTRLIESQSEGLLCSVLLLDEENRLRHGAAPSLPDAYNQAVDGLLIGPKVGSCGTAAYRREPVLVTDILQDPLWEDGRAIAAEHGLRACWSTPFFSRQGQVLGTFAMYYRTPRAPSSTETELVETATRLASIAVERSLSDQKLHGAAEDFRVLVENLNDIVVSVDVKGDVSYISPRIESLSGYQPNEVVGKPFGRLVHKEDLASLQDCFASTLAGNPKPCEFRVLDKQGSAHWWRVSGRPQYLRNQVVGVTGVVVDITGQKETQDALRKAEQRYRTFFEEALVGIFRSYPEGHFVTVNPALARMLGYDSPEDLTASIRDAAHQVYVESERRDEFKLLMEKDGSVRNFEAEVYRKNGTRMWLSTNARAVYENGRIVAYEGTSEDVTDRKLLEQQLVQAQKMEAVGQLAGGIAHDFNNLLGVILGHGELLLSRVHTSDPLRRRIEQICQAGSRAVSLTGQLLAFSRQQILHLVVLDLNAVVQNVNDMIGRLIGEDIRVVSKLDRALGRVKADPGQIEQVLLNLVLNARDAMPAGGTLTIETSNVDVDQMARRYTGAKEGRYALLVVGDTGIGMDHATMSRIFEPFFTTKEAGKGTGLGLATAYGIVKQSGGYISVTSEPGQGTTFSIYLPRTEDAAETARTWQGASETAKRSATILLVEDADPLREVTREFLEEEGYEVLEANGADRALRAVEEYPAPISLMITDVVMPGMNGHKLAERLQSMRPETKVLYVSGYTDEAVFRQGVRPSETNFLHKPYTRDGLLTKLRQVLDVSSSQAQTPSP
ncbi:MAG TPA: PAS domain S-box protein [Terriglobales bacterium]|nr:PAS domain S-box protein [Terriglobales bacterium]